MSEMQPFLTSALSGRISDISFLYLYRLSAVRRVLRKGFPAMILSNIIDTTLQKTFIPPTEEMYGISHPVIRKDGDGYCLSSYCFTYTKPEAGKYVLSRPMWYCTADLNSGALLSIHSCSSSNDFSTADRSGTYTVLQGDCSKNIRYQNIAHLLDEARKELQKSGEPVSPPYREYMEALLAMVPDAFGRFYLDLSVPLDDTEDAQAFRVLRDEVVVRAGENMPAQGSVHVPSTGKGPDAPAAPPEKPAHTDGHGPESRLIVEAVRAACRSYDSSFSNCAGREWKPERNLSLLSPDRFMALLRLSETIQFLDTGGNEGIKFSHPALCTRRDFTRGADTWQELQYRALLQKDVLRGHLMITPRKNLFTRCTASVAKKCVFPYCPYIVAAYMRYLAEGFKDRLFQEAEQGVSGHIRSGGPLPADKVRIPKTDLDRASTWIRCGLCSIRESKNAYRITATVCGQACAGPLDAFYASPVLFYDSISKEAALCGTDESGRFRMDDGRPFNKELGDLLAAFLIGHDCLPEHFPRTIRIAP